MEEKKLVTIAVPLYNAARCLREALDSLLAQTYHNFEVIISDNASTDATQRISEEYVKKDGRIRYIRQKKNIGAIGNYNFLLQEARGDYFMWAAYDDTWDASFLEKCVTALERDASLVLAMSDFNRVDKETGVTERYLAERSVPEEKELYSRLRHHILMYLSSGKGVPIYGLWRKSAIMDIPLVNDWSYFPIRFIFSALFRGSAVIIHETLFFKGAPLSPSNKKNPLIVRIWFTCKDRVRKFFSRLFYANMAMIARSHKLNAGEKAKLIFWQCVVMLRLFLVRVT